MSTDAPRPERVTLGDEEITFVYNWTPPDADTRDAFAKELAGFFDAREQALREEISQQIGDDLEAAPVSTEGIGWYRANRRAARIARGETR